MGYEIWFWESNQATGKIKITHTQNMGDSTPRMQHKRQRHQCDIDRYYLLSYMVPSIVDVAQKLFSIPILIWNYLDNTPRD